MFISFHLEVFLSVIPGTRFTLAILLQSTLSIQCINVRGLLMSWDNTTWYYAVAYRNGKFNGCLHYAVIKSEANLFRIMAIVSQVLAFILLLIFQFPKSIFLFICNSILRTCFLPVILKFTVVNHFMPLVSFDAPWKGCHCTILWLVVAYTFISTWRYRKQPRTKPRTLKNFLVITGM